MLIPTRGNHFAGDVKNGGKISTRGSDIHIGGRLGKMARHTPYRSPSVVHVLLPPDDGGDDGHLSSEIPRDTSRFDSSNLPKEI